MKASKICISGASGFIGKALSKTLTSQGYEVIAIPRETLYLPDELKKFFTLHKPDYIYHLAAYGNMANQKEESSILIANVIVLMNMLLASSDINYKAFINMGSSSEYGKKTEPMTEDMLPEAEDFYGCSKVAATYIARAFAKQRCKPVVTVRPFSVYGPDEAKFRFIPQVIKNLREGLVMDVDMYAVHDWIYIDDLISGMLVVADHARELFGEVINIGTGKQTKNLEIVNLLESISSKILAINYFSNMRPSASPIWVDGSNKLKDLAWEPKVSLEEGLRRIYENNK